MTASEDTMAARLVAGQIGGRAVRTAFDDDAAHRFEVRGAHWAIALEVARAVVDDVEEASPEPLVEPEPVEPTTRIRPFRLRASRRRGPVTGTAVQLALTGAVERAALDGAAPLNRARGVKGRHLFVWIGGSAGESRAGLFSSNPPFDGPELAPGVNVAWVAPWVGGALPPVLWCASPDWERPKEVVLGEGLE